MSCKSNGIKLTKCDSQQWKTASILETPSVKFAGEEAKDRLYEPKHKKKLFRVLTVVAYVFFVSLAAIMLSLYYVFLWNGDQRVAAKLVGKQKLAGTKCENVIAEIQKQIRLMETNQPMFLRTAPMSTTPLGSTQKTITWGDTELISNLEDLRSSSNFLKKLLNEDPYND